VGSVRDRPNGGNYRPRNTAAGAAHRGGRGTEGGDGRHGRKPIFDRLQARFSNCTSCEHEVIAAGASGDLAYIVAFEHTTVSVNGSPSLPYTLRATTVFRRENGEWKVVHRHADPVASENAAELLQRLVVTDA
jgi:hypothetical protein